MACPSRRPIAPVTPYALPPAPTDDQSGRGHHDRHACGRWLRDDDVEGKASHSRAAAGLAAHHENELLARLRTVDLKHVHVDESVSRDAAAGGRSPDRRAAHRLLQHDFRRGPDRRVQSVGHDAHAELCRSAGANLKSPTLGRGDGQGAVDAQGRALRSLVGSQDDVKAAIADSYVPAFENGYLNGLRAKLGLQDALPGDEDFIGETLSLLQRFHPDYTTFFRALSRLPGAVTDASRATVDAPLRDHFIDRDACDAWLTLWRARLAAEGSRDEIRQAAMLAVNPKYVLRNWVAEEAIRAAQQGDDRVTAEVLACLSRPFDEQPEFERYAAPPPDWAQHLAVSCSS